VGVSASRSGEEAAPSRRSRQPGHGTPGRALFFAFLALFVWLPLPLGSNRPWAWAMMEAWVYALAAAWLWGYARGARKATVAFERARPVLWLLGVWLCYGLLQLVPLPHDLLAWLSPEAAKIYAETQAALGDPRAARLWPVTLDLHASIVAWLKSLAYVLIFALALLLVDSRGRLRQLAYVLVITAVFQATLASAMALGRWDLGFSPNSSVAHGTFVNRNHLAGFLVMNLSVGIGLLLASLESGAYSGSARQRLRSVARLLLSGKLRLRLYLAVMVIALVLTHSRMGNTAFLSSLLIAGVLALILFKEAPRPTVLLISSLIVIDLSILGAWFGVDRVVERIEQTRLATETRDQVDEYTVRLWHDFPLLGSGMGTFYTAFPRYRGADVGAFFDHAHNDYLEILSEAGVAGFGLLAAVVVLSLRAALQAQRRRHDPIMRGMAFGATMAMVGILVHSTVDFNLQIPANAALFVVILAVSWVALSVPVGSRGRREWTP
jgi:O-antigen ligase